MESMGSVTCFFESTIVHWICFEIQNFSKHVPNGNWNGTETPCVVRRIREKWEGLLQGFHKLQMDFRAEIKPPNIPPYISNKKGKGITYARKITLEEVHNL